MNNTTYQSRVTQKGQVTIPAELRKELGIKPKDRVRFIHENGRIVVERVESVVAKVAGAVPPLPDSPLTAEELREQFEVAVAEEVTRELENERKDWESGREEKASDNH